jgi:hypothetical protein
MWTGQAEATTSASARALPTMVQLPEVEREKLIQETTRSAASRAFLAGGAEGKRGPLPTGARLQGLKGQWGYINREYQGLTLSLFNLDTIGKVPAQPNREPY